MHIGIKQTLGIPAPHGIVTIIASAVNILVFVLAAISGYVWFRKKRNAVVEIHPKHSITFSGYTLKREDLKKAWIQDGPARVMASSGGGA